MSRPTLNNSREACSAEMPISRIIGCACVHRDQGMHHYSLPLTISLTPHPSLTSIEIRTNQLILIIGCGLVWGLNNKKNM